MSFIFPLIFSGGEEEEPEQFSVTTPKSVPLKIVSCTILQRLYFLALFLVLFRLFFHFCSEVWHHFIEFVFDGFFFERLTFSIKVKRYFRISKTQLSKMTSALFARQKQSKEFKNKAYSDSMRKQIHLVQTI